MEKTQFLSEEAKKKIAELQSEISKAKEKIRMALGNEAGVSYIIDTDKKAVNILDFSASLGVIPTYLDIIKNCYALMDEIVRKSIEVKNHNEKKSNYGIYIDEIKKCVWKEFIEDFKSNRLTFFKPDEKSESKLAATREAKSSDNMENQQIKIGDRVKLKGDSNSPEMTVTMDISKEIARQNGISAIGKGVQDATVFPDGIFECSYFVVNEENEILKNFHQHRFHKDALEKINK